MTIAGYGTFVKGSSIQYMDQVAQNTIMSNFQPYQEDFWVTEGGVMADAYDLSVIQDIPVAMLMAKYDEVCKNEQNLTTKS